MNAFLIALLASAAVLVSARNVKLSGRLLTPDEQTLKTLLSTPGGGSIGGGDSKVPVGLLEYNFNRDFDERINPNTPTSDFKWLSVKGNNGQYVADSGTLIRDGISATELVSIPFRQFLPQSSGRLGLLTNYEAVLANKIKFVVEPQNKLTVRSTFSAQFKNVEDHPYGKNAVVNATDDPSLICAGISLASSGKGGLVFSIVATEKGIWAVYERNRVGLVQHPERDDKIFTIYHRLADRASQEEEIDAAITYDRSQNAVHFKLNNVVVYTLKNLGTLPVNEVGTLAHTVSRPDLVVVEPKEFTVMVGLMSAMDAQDPNQQAHSMHNQRLTNEDVYDTKAKFVDETGNQMYNLWGQGAIMKIHDLVIRLQESTGKKANNNKDELSVRTNKDDVNEDTDDGKLIVPAATADGKEVSSIVGDDRTPRIEEGEEQVSAEDDSAQDDQPDEEQTVRQGRANQLTKDIKNPQAFKKVSNPTRGLPQGQRMQ